jgi:hypothetical protein
MPFSAPESKTTLIVVEPRAAVAGPARGLPDRPGERVA